MVALAASKVDMRRHFKGGVDTLRCEVRRHRTNGTVRWPSLGAKDDDSWFACTIRHSEGLFVITTFLRHSPGVPNIIYPGFQWIPVADKDIISTTGKVFALSLMSGAYSALQRVYGGNHTVFVSFFMSLFLCACQL